MQTKKKVNSLTLDAMIGKRWKHGAKIYQFAEFRKNDGKTSIATDQGFLDFDNNQDLCRFLAICQKVTTPKHQIVVRGEEQKPVKHEDSDLMIGIRDTLLKDLEMLTEEPDYVKQAVAKTKTVNSLINLAKLKLTMKGL